MSANGDFDHPPDSTPMDVDTDADMPGAFVNGNGSTDHDQTDGDDSPAPPLHKTPSPPPKPSIDPEACKALGNKYFKAKDYTAAIAEYTKGRYCLEGLIP